VRYSKIYFIASGRKKFLIFELPLVQVSNEAIFFFGNHCGWLRWILTEFVLAVSASVVSLLRHDREAL